MRRSLIVFIFSYSVVAQAASSITVIPPIIVKPTINFTNNASQQIISRDDLKESGVNTVAQALQELGALQLQDSSGNSSQAILSMRGFGANASSNTLILINGIPLTNPDMASPDLNLIPLEDIQLIQIVSGSQSVTYGDQAVGGIINIITSPKLAHQINVACSIGSYDANKCYANLSSSYKNFLFGLSGITSHTDNYREHNNYDQHSLFGNIGYNYTSGELSFNYHIANEKLLYAGALTHPQVVEHRRQSTNDTDYFQDWNGYFHLQQHQKLNTHWQLQTDLARREMHGNGVLTSPFYQSRVIYFLKPQLIGNFIKAKIKSGLDFEKDRYNLTSDFGSTTDAQKKYGAYVFGDYALRTKLILNGGIRGAQQNNQLTSYNNIASLNRATATTIGLKYLLNPNLNWYVTRAGSFRFPKADEDADVPVGVKYLKTQKGVSYETGLAWKYKRAEANAEIYQLNLRDEIAFDPFQTPARPFGTNRNLDPTVRKGLLLSEKYYLNDKLSVGAHYNFVNARFQSGIYAGKRIPLVAENILRADLDYQFRENWNVFLEAVYTGDEYPDNDNANIATKVGGYTIYNFNIHYRFKNASVAFRINNVFNKQYYSYTVYQPSLLTEFFYPAPERNLSLEFKFYML